MKDCNIYISDYCYIEYCIPGRLMVYKQINILIFVLIKYKYLLLVIEIISLIITLIISTFTGDNVHNFRS